MLKKLKILFTFFLANVLFSQTFTGIGGEIPKNDYQVYDILVKSVGNLDAKYGLEKVCIVLEFPTDENLKIALRSPFGTIIYLSQKNGGQGSDYFGTCFTATAKDYIFQGDAPFDGEFLPETGLGVLNNNYSGDGTWSLIIYNDAINIKGNLVSWSLTFGNHPAPKPVLPAYPDCSVKVDAGAQTSFCENGKYYCTYFDASSGPPYTLPLTTSFVFKAGENSARFNIWMTHGQPEYNITGAPIQFYLKLSLYDITSGNLIDQFLLPYKLSQTYQDTTFFTISINDLKICDSYQVIAKGTGGGCSFDYAIQMIKGADEKGIEVLPQSPKICNGDSVALDIMKGCGPFVWSPSTGLDTTSGEHVIASPTQTTTYTVTSLGTCPKTKQVTVEIVPRPIANAGTDQIKCSNIFEMNASVPTTGESGHWEIVSGSVSPATSSNPNQIFILNSKNAVLRWVVKNDFCSSSDDIFIENLNFGLINLDFSYTSPICIKKISQLLPKLSSNFTQGGQFSSSAGLDINSITGIINLQNSLPGNYIVSYIIPNSSCGNAVNGFYLEIKPYLDPVVEFQYPNAICSDEKFISPVLKSNFQNGGVFKTTSNDLVINSVTGIIDVLSSKIGTYVVTYTYSGSLDDCFKPKSYSQQISIFQKPQYVDQVEIKTCDIGNGGIGIFNLNQAITLLTSEKNPSISFFKDYNDAVLGINAITNVLNYQNIVANSDKVFARIEIQNKCTVYSTVILTVKKNPYSEVLGNGPYYLCKDSQITLDVGSGYISEWLTDPVHQFTNSILVSAGGKYCAKITKDGCTTTQCVEVIEFSPPSFEVEISSGKIIIKVVSGNQPFQYSSDGSNWQNENVFSYNGGGSFTIFVRETTKSLCSSFKVINIPFVPNVVTPNNDGYNDNWDLSSFKFYSDVIKVNLFDKYGKQVLKTTINGNENLDGKIDMKNFPTGTYWYVLDIPLVYVFKGWLLIKNKL